MPIYEFYVPWDTASFMTGINQLMGNFGTIITVGIRGFLIVTGIYLIIKIGNSMLG